MTDEMRERARELRQNRTDAEQRLWSRLRDKRLNNVKFRRQQPIGDYIVDFVSFNVELIVELDGGQHVEQESYDEQRTAWLEERGYTVLRFWNDDVLTNTEQVLEQILRVIKDT